VGVDGHLKGCKANYILILLGRLELMPSKYPGLTLNELRNKVTYVSVAESLFRRVKEHSTEIRFVGSTC